MTTITTKIINLFAGPGSGKSTLAAGLFFRLKTEGYNAELAGEFAKDLTWARRFATLEDQLYVFGKQHHRIFRLIGQCDVIVADSPILLGLAYSDGYPKCYEDTVIWAFNQYDNINFFVKRTKPYNPSGRNQTYHEAIKKDLYIQYLLDECDVPYIETTSDDSGIEKIMTELKKVIDIS